MLCSLGLRPVAKPFFFACGLSTESGSNMGPMGWSFPSGLSNWVEIECETESRAEGISNGASMITGMEIESSAAEFKPKIRRLFSVGFPQNLPSLNYLGRFPYGSSS